MDNINDLLVSYLKELGLPMFAQNYQRVAEEVAGSDLSYERFLLALAEQEIAFREQKRRAGNTSSAELKKPENIDLTSLPGQWHLMPTSVLNEDKDKSG